MFISSILKQKRANKELENRLKQSVEATANLFKVLDTENEATDSIEAFERATQQSKPEKKTLIKFKYPGKTVQQADIEHHRRIHEEELQYRTQYQQWTERRERRAAEVPPGTEAIETAQDQAPTYIKPTSNVVKVGDTHMEILMERQLNRDTGNYDWVKQEMEILERPENNDTGMEDNSVTYENKEKTKIDWETTLTNIKENGEKLGYNQKHFLKCLLRIMNQHDDDLYHTYKEETCPEKIANSLLSRYIGLNKKKIFENKLKTLTRTKGQPLREVMCQADVLADRILQKCRDPQEKAFRKHQIMLDALKSFSSEENAKELMQALRGSSLSGERPDIEELIDTVETAERINENSKPDRDRTFLNENTGEKCELFAVSAAEQQKELEDAIRKTKEMSMRGREERRPTQETNKGFRNRSNERGQNDRRTNNEWGNQRYSNPRDRLRSTERNRSRDDQRRDSSQQGGYQRTRGYSRERENSSTNRSKSRERENFNQDRRNGSNERTKGNTWTTRERQRSSERGEQRSNQSSYRGRENSRENQRYRENSNTRTGKSQGGNNEFERDLRRSEYRERNSSQSDRAPRKYDERSWEAPRSGYNDRRSPQRESRRNGYRERDDSRSNRERNNSGTNRNFRSQSRERRSWMTVPPHKRNLEGVEFPPKTQMDLSVQFCVKCYNSLEKHYPWDCKLYRYWSSNPCDICYNGQHRSKECRKNPNRVDAFTVMLENSQTSNQTKNEQNFTPF